MVSKQIQNIWITPTTLAKSIEIQMKENNISLYPHIQISHITYEHTNKHTNYFSPGFDELGHMLFTLMHIFDDMHSLNRRQCTTRVAFCLPYSQWQFH